jgi:hypothetical protein
MAGTLFWNMSRTGRALYAVVFVAVSVPSVTHAQTAYAITLGRTVTSALPFTPDWYTGGITVQLSAYRRLGARLGAEVAAYTSSFQEYQLLVAPCDCPTVGPCSCPAYTESFGLRWTGLTVSGVADLTAPRALTRCFLQAGAGGAFISDELRPELSAGAGLAIPVHAPVQLLLDMRIHALLGRNPGGWQIPLTLGLQF